MYIRENENRGEFDFFVLLFLPKIRETAQKGWIRFVNVKRAMWNPTKYSGICSAHFANEDFTKRFVQMSGNTPG